MTALACTVCGQLVDACACANADDRLRAMAYGPENTSLMFKWCRRCDKHYARCQCETPVFFIISGGEDITAQVEHGLPNAAGGVTIPDLSRR